MDFDNISSSLFRPATPLGVLTIDGQTYTIYNPSEVKGKVEVVPACPPKTDFDKYYKNNLAYFNLFSSEIYGGYLEDCENAIHRQKLKSKAECVGGALRANGMLYLYGLVITVSLIILGLNSMFHFM